MQPPTRAIRARQHGHGRVVRAMCKALLASSVSSNGDGTLLLLLSPCRCRRSRATIAAEGRWVCRSRFHQTMSDTPMHKPLA